MGEEAKRMYWDNWAGMFIALVAIPPFVVATSSWRHAAAVLFMGGALMMMCGVHEISMAIKSSARPAPNSQKSGGVKEDG